MASTFGVIVETEKIIVSNDFSVTGTSTLGSVTVNNTISYTDGSRGLKTDGSQVLDDVFKLYAPGTNDFISFAAGKPYGISTLYLKSNYPNPSLQHAEIYSNRIYLAYSAASTPKGLYIYDISTPTNPVFLGSNTTYGLGDFSRQSNYVFAATDEENPGRLVAYDVADESNPTIVSMDSNTTSHAYNAARTHMVADNSHAFVLWKSGSGSSSPDMCVFDITVPTNVFLTNTFTVGNEWDSMVLGKNGNYLYYGYHYNSWAEHAIKTYDVSNVTNIVLTATTNILSMGGTSDRMCFKNNHIVWTGSSTNIIELDDISIGSNPVLSSVCALTNQTADGGKSFSFNANTNYMYILQLSQSPNNLSVVNISDVTNMFQVFSKNNVGLYNSYGIYVNDDYMVIRSEFAAKAFELDGLLNKTSAKTEMNELVANEIKLGGIKRTSWPAEGSNTIYYTNWPAWTNDISTNYFGMVVYLNTNKNWQMACADYQYGGFDPIYNMLGLIVNSNALNGILTRGLYTYNRGILEYMGIAPLKVGKPVYLYYDYTMAGFITQVRSETTDKFIRILGYAIATNGIYFDPCGMPDNPIPIVPP
jgi:hypothetical protein